MSVKSKEKGLPPQNEIFAGIGQQKLKKSDIMTLGEFAKSLKDGKEGEIRPEESRFRRKLLPALEKDWNTSNTRGEVISEVNGTRYQKGAFAEEYAQWLKFKIQNATNTGIGEGYEPDTSRRTILQDIRTSLEEPKLMNL